MEGQSEYYNRLLASSVAHQRRVISMYFYRSITQRSSCDRRHYIR